MPPPTCCHGLGVSVFNVLIRLDMNTTMYYQDINTVWVPPLACTCLAQTCCICIHVQWQKVGKNPASNPCSPFRILSRHILSGVQLWYSVPSMQRIVGIGDCPAVMAQWALPAQARGVLGSTHGNCGLFTFLYFHLITSKFPPWTTACFKKCPQN